MNISRQEFEKLVFDTAAKIITSLPDDLRERAGSIVFAAADHDQAQTAEGDENAGDELLGIYEGTPLTERSLDEVRIVPDRITLFRLPLMDMCQSRRELREEIRITILHELAHFFGFEERDLEERGLG